MRTILTLCAIFVSSDALAYIGPGPGLAMVGPLIGVIIGLVIAIGMVAAYPIRLYLKRRRQNKL